ncbi:septation protein A [Gallibacterium salpingitidis]|uniref:Inner membrane-spanning protein YciB n=1 Tax=Gallibacterium salpingitidis TaxID=505341 RepID=A0AB36E4F9_9PAST|nr:septation protein A [Gallibacterium salpingitidis]OBX07319.1 septation protein A [Gallibacterium salpingitidis]OBX10739.1 septation protein A [Gallibacterium salpingitidis]WKS98980.1 septation protein A [Gallibacterium salpingitidis]
MKQLLEFIPLILFFAVYKLFGVREAAITLIVATIIQFIILKVKYGKIEKSQWIMAIGIVFFGSLTAYFNDLEFLKWKVTIVYALFALILLISQFGFKKLLIKSMLGKEIQLPEKIWANLNLGWGIFFIVCMLINLYVSLFLSDDIWVDFKSFGFFGLTLAASLLTGVYVYPHITAQAKDKNKD